MLCVLRSILLHASAKKKTKVAERFKISRFHGSFSSGIMPVKGLTDNRDEEMDSKSLLVQRASADERRGAIDSLLVR